MPSTNKDRLDFIKKQREGWFEQYGIHHTAVVEDYGMGYEWEDGWVEFPQKGGVKIGKDVRIGAYSTIKRATLENNYTVIGDGCKIGSHCNIGHNTILGKNCLLAHRVSIAGSCEIGDNVVFWQGCLIAHKVKIGNGAVIAQGANVLKDVPAGMLVKGLWA